MEPIEILAAIKAASDLITLGADVMHRMQTDGAPATAEETTRLKTGYALAKSQWSSLAPVDPPAPIGS